MSPRWSPGSVLLLLTLAFAGCLEPEETMRALDPGPVGPVAGAPLWNDSTAAPHPAFGWATYTHPPADATGWWRPIAARALPDPVVGLGPVAAAKDLVPVSGGIALFGSLAIATTWQIGSDAASTTATILDISDPTTPKHVSTFGDVPARDAGIIAYPDGRLVAVFATDSKVIPVWDITDPTAPELLSVIQPPTNSHNIAIVPGTTYLYNANAAGQGATLWSALFGGASLIGQTEIYDLTDPSEPQEAIIFDNGYGCHDISFHITPHRQRAYCAGVEVTQIWDIVDPLRPTIVSTIPTPHGAGHLNRPPSLGPVMESHLAIVNDDATVLLIGDETFAGMAPGCDVAGGPLGDLWFYDISDEERPSFVGKVEAEPYFATNPPPHDGALAVAACTAHFGRLVPDPERDLVAMAWYGAGVLLIDFTDPAAARVLDQWNPGTNTWDVWYMGGYLVTGDVARGMDVLTFR